MSKTYTDEEMELLRKHRREQRRKYWDDMPEEKRKAKRKEANQRFWGSMTLEERREKRKQYDLAQAKRKAAASNNNAE